MRRRSAVASELVSDVGGPCARRWAGLVPDVRVKKLRLFAYENAAGVLVVLDVAYTRHENVAYKM